MQQPHTWLLSIPLPTLLRPSKTQRGLYTGWGAPLSCWLTCCYCCCCHHVSCIIFRLFERSQPVGAFHFFFSCLVCFISFATNDKLNQMQNLGNFIETGASLSSSVYWFILSPNKTSRWCLLPSYISLVVLDNILI